MAASNLITGAKALITGKNGAVLGYATGIVVQETIFNARVETLGTVDTRELEAISRQVTGSISFMRIFDKDVTGGLIVNAEGNLVQRSADILSDARDDFDLTIYSIASAQTDPVPENPSISAVYKVMGCRVSSQTIAVDRGSFMGLNVTFDALQLVKLDQNGATEIDGYTIPTT